MDSCIKLRVNSMARGKGTGDAWGIAVRKQLGGYAGNHAWKMSDGEKKKRFRKEWKKKVEHGKRWLVEIAPSAFKRMFGERLYSLKWKNMVQKVRIKVATYNRLVDMRAGAAWSKICRARACSKRAGGIMQHTICQKNLITLHAQ